MSEVVKVETSIPRRYLDVIKEMVDMDPEDSLEFFLRRSITVDADSLVDCPDFLFDIYKTRWDRMLKA